MDRSSNDDQDAVDTARAQRTTRLIAHLDGALDEQMLDAMAGIWSMLEHASTDAPAHARAVRSRLFWESLAPGGVAAAPGGEVIQLPARWADGDDPRGADAAEAA